VEGVRNLLVLAFCLWHSRTWEIAGTCARGVWRQDRFQFRLRWPRTAAALSRFGLLYRRVWICRAEDPTVGEWVVTEA
jgi:hypothetical protein